MHSHISIISDKKIICSYVDTPASGGGVPSHAGEAPIEAFCRAGDRMTLALGKVDSSAGEDLGQLEIFTAFNVLHSEYCCLKFG